jgi:hypothetical protein
LPCGLADCAVQLRQRVLIPPLPSPSPPFRKGEEGGVQPAATNRDSTPMNSDSTPMNPDSLTMNHDSAPMNPDSLTMNHDSTPVNHDSTTKDRNALSGIRER